MAVCSSKTEITVTMDENEYWLIAHAMDYYYMGLNDGEDKDPETLKRLGSLKNDWKVVNS